MPENLTPDNAPEIAGGGYPRNYAAIKLWIQARSGGLCECGGICGSNHLHRCKVKARDVCHLTGDRRQNGPDQVKHMCRPCHMAYDIMTSAALKESKGDRMRETVAKIKAERDAGIRPAKLYRGHRPRQPLAEGAD